MSASEALVSATTITLSGSLTFTSAPARVLITYVSPSTRSIAPRTRTVSCATAGSAKAVTSAIVPRMPKTARVMKSSLDVLIMNAAEPPIIPREPACCCVSRSWAAKIYSGDGGYRKHRQRARREHRGRTPGHPSALRPYHALDQRAGDAGHDRLDVRITHWINALA